MNPSFDPKFVENGTGRYVSDMRKDIKEAADLYGISPKAIAGVIIYNGNGAAKPIGKISLETAKRVENEGLIPRRKGRRASDAGLADMLKNPKIAVLYINSSDRFLKGVKEGNRARKTWSV
jgi:hypothetical protein